MALQILFWLVLAAVLLNGAAVVLSILRPDRRIWPPPGRDSWQYRYNGVTVYTGLCGLLALGIADWNSFVFHGAGRFAVGGLLMACALFALWGYLTLGARASQGLGESLVTTGPYRCSRNPQYVGTIPAVLGYAVFCNSGLALVVALLLCIWFALVPFAEESWCREHLGSAWDDYAAVVPRYLGRCAARAEGGRHAD